jgi:hypothetical protein
MSTGSKWLICVFAIAVILTTAAMYYRVFVLKDYMVSIEVPCDPEAGESCFIYIDEESEEEILYKIVEKPAYLLPSCDPAEEACLESVICELGEYECEITYCDPANAEEGECTS